jgi:hypothetical protein
VHTDPESGKSTDLLLIGDPRDRGVFIIIKKKRFKDLINTMLVGYPFSGYTPVLGIGGTHASHSNARIMEASIPNQ